MQVYVHLRLETRAKQFSVNNFVSQFRHSLLCVAEKHSNSDCHVPPLNDDCVYTPIALTLSSRFRCFSLEHQYHPDRNTEPNATETFQKISEAYEVLTDKEARKKCVSV